MFDDDGKLGNNAFMGMVNIPLAGLIARQGGQAGEGERQEQNYSQTNLRWYPLSQKGDDLSACADDGYKSEYGALGLRAGLEAGNREG